MIATVVPASGNATTTVRMSVAWDGSEVARSSYQVAISAGGSTVAFVSEAAHLVDGDTNDVFDVFVHTVATGETRRVSVRSNGTEANGWSEGSSLSADGRYVAFESSASNLVPGDRNRNLDVFVHDLVMGSTARVSLRSNGGEADGASWEPAISGDGTLIAFTSGAENLVRGDRNGRSDAFVATRTGSRMSSCTGSGPDARRA